VAPALVIAAASLLPTSNLAARIAPLPPLRSRSLQLSTSSSSVISRSYVHGLPRSENWYQHTVSNETLLTAEREVELGEAIGVARDLKAQRIALAARLERTPTLAEWAADSGLQADALLVAVHEGDEAHRELVERNLRLVCKIVGKYAHFRSAIKVSFEDLAQEGTLGLIRAAEKWDPSRGFRFATFAWIAIRNAVVSALTDELSPCTVPQSARYSVQQMRDVIRDGAAELGRQPTVHELADRLHISPRRVETLLETLRQSSPGSTRSLDAPIAQTTSLRLRDTLRSDMPMPDDVLDSEDGLQTAAQRVEAALQFLNERERFVITWRYGLRPEDRDRPDQDRKSFRTATFRSRADRSIREVAEAIGLSPPRTSEILNVALTKLRRSSYAEELRDSLGDVGI